MGMPKLTPGHARFEKFVGDWTGTENMLPSHWDPDGLVAGGRNACRLSLNGFAIMNVYEQRRGGEVTFTGHGVLTYDFSRKDYWAGRMEMSTDGESWNTLFAAEYTRG